MILNNVCEDEEKMKEFLKFLYYKNYKEINKFRFDFYFKKDL